MIPIARQVDCTPVTFMAAEATAQVGGTTSCFFRLPSELRDQIYELLILKERNIITLITNHDCMHSQVSARQPAIAWVNRQARQEALSILYGTNVFQADLSDGIDLCVAKNWLRAIGDINVARLRHLSLHGATKVPLGHMACRRWIVVEIDLRDGKLQIDGKANEPDRHPHNIEAITNLETSFARLVAGREGQPLDIDALSSLFDGFHGLCST